MIKIQGSGINPTLLGVPDRWVEANPTVSRFPAKFNNDALYVWTAVLADPAFLAKSKALSTTERWSLAIQMYLVACGNDDNLDPFDRGQLNDVADNTRILSLLNRARRHVVRWFERTELLSIFTIREVWTQVDLSEHGFILSSCCKAQYDGSPHELEQLLRSAAVGLKPVVSTKGRVLGCMIDPTVWLYVTVKNSSWVHIHYRMVVNHRFYHPDIERGIAVRKGDLKDWIERTLWLPAVRAYRFQQRTSRRTTLF